MMNTKRATKGAESSGRELGDKRPGPHGVVIGGRRGGIRVSTKKGRCMKVDIALLGGALPILGPRLGGEFDRPLSSRRDQEPEHNL